jgi:adenosine deaminase
MSEETSAIDPRLEAFVRRMPKAEIHVHLEGSVRPATLLQLAQRNGVKPPAADEAGLREFFRFRDFPHFIEVYIAVCSCLRTPEDFATIVREVGEDAAAQNIRYLELHFNPETNVRKRGLDFHEMLAGMNRGRAEARELWGVEMRWIADGVRDS